MRDPAAAGSLIEPHDRGRDGYMPPIEKPRAAHVHEQPGWVVPPTHTAKVRDVDVGAFRDAWFRADEMGVDLIGPNEIYAHLVCPEPRIAEGAHVDIPNFRGMGRRDYPTWLLVNMRRSGLFDRWHVPVATAVMWFYEGPGGRRVPHRTT